MKELFYYFIFAIILYFVLTYVFDNFNLEQENFDPSLVPISSIVSLSKVAQKIVNGNGTLTNPGNLQIGNSTNDPKNLIVTGTINSNNSLIISNNLNTNNLEVTNNAIINNNVNIDNVEVSNISNIYAKGNLEIDDLIINENFSNKLFKNIYLESVTFNGNNNNDTFELPKLQEVINTANNNKSWKVSNYLTGTGALNSRPGTNLSLYSFMYIPVIGPPQYQQCANTTITQTIRYYCGYIDFKTRKNPKIIESDICSKTFLKSELPNNGNGIPIILDCSSS